MWRVSLSNTSERSVLTCKVLSFDTAARAPVACTYSTSRSSEMSSKATAQNIRIKTDVWRIRQFEVI
jgi:hypothetical protein